VEANTWSTIVVPCYNEALRLRTESFRQFVELGHPIRFLFVNDGSTDGTLAVLEAMRQGLEERIQILDKQNNGGKGEAVRDGLLHACRAADAAFVEFWDADLATPLEPIPFMLERLEMDPHLEMLFGSRVRLLGRQIHRKAVRHYLGRIFASVVSVVLRLPVYDTQCGAKLFRVTPELPQILAEPFLSRWVFDVEILARSIALHHGDVEYVAQSVYEFPLLRWEDVSGSKVRPGDFLKAFLDVVRIYRRYLA
jgi:glycosyltransferase involved in cell wall biosynthesis